MAWSTSPTPKTAMAMTKADAEELASLIVEALSKAKQSELIDQYMETARVNNALDRERDTTARLRAENAALRAHIANLKNAIIADPSIPGVAYGSAAVSAFPDRFAATMPLPPIMDSYQTTTES